MAQLGQCLDMGHVSVVAEEIAGAVGDRADDSDPAGVGSERQGPVVFDEHHRPGREVGGQGPFVDLEGGE